MFEGLLQGSLANQVPAPPMTNIKLPEAPRRGQREGGIADTL